MISEECKGCDYYIKPYGCIEHDCPVYKEWEQGMSEMMADFDHDKRKDNRIHPIFDGIMKNIQGDI